MRGFGWPLIEYRSMQGSVDQVLAFYGGMIERAGLAITESLPLGGWPGIYAENAEYFLGIEIYEHKDLVFWTVQLSSTRQRRQKVLHSRFFLLLGRNDERVTLRHESKDEEYWAPVDAVRDSEPPDVERPRIEPITWSLLPAWIQFGTESGRQGKAVRYQGESGAEEWNSHIDRPFEGNAQAMFESCLDNLDSRGFDASGTKRPDRSYFVSLCGVQLTAHIQSEAGDRASVTVVNTLGYLTLFIRYSPSQGVPLPLSA